MPKVLDLNDELERVTRLVAVDPSVKTNVMLAIPADLYLLLVKDTIANNPDSAVSRHCIDILRTYFSGRVDIENDLSTDQLSLLRSLAAHWKCDTTEVLERLLTRLQDNDALELFTDRDREKDRERAALIRSL